MKKTQWFLKSSRMFCLHQDLAHITVDGQDMDSAGAARWVNGDILIQPVSPPCPGGFPGMNFVGFLPWRWGGEWLEIEKHAMISKAQK